VLLTSYTNAAVDNLLMKLMSKGVATTSIEQPLPALVRVGRQGACHGGVLPILTSTIALELEKDTAMLDDEDEPTLPSASYLQRSVESARIVGVTALSAPRSPQLVGQHFDVVIVDEAGQISQPAIIGALMAADAFVLVGDHMQLPPLVSSELAERGGKLPSVRQQSWNAIVAVIHPSVSTSRIWRLNAQAPCRCTPGLGDQVKLSVSNE
jgi:DNA replication ATP-dependent helicase Dna2